MSCFITRVADPAALFNAWARVRRAGGAAPGPDGVTLDVFRTGVDAHIRRLSGLLLNRRYAPGPVRRVHLRKDDGGFRALGMPNVSDRVVQNAAATVLQEMFEPLFSPASFAYREGRGARRAAERWLELTRSAGWAVTADIAKFFDNVDHGLLATLLGARGVDQEGIRLIRSWLLAQSLERSTRLQPVKGLPQGAPIAPILANVYLTPIDDALTAAGMSHVRYADDIVIATSTEADAADALRLLTASLAELKLSLKPAKTQHSEVSEGVDFVGYRFGSGVAAIVPPKVESFRVRIKEVLAGPATGFGDAIKSHNDLVRGWRSYYAGFSEGVDRDLAVADAWRNAEALSYGHRIGIAESVIIGCLERLVEPDNRIRPAGYPDIEQERPENATVPASAAARVRLFSSQKTLRNRAIGESQSPALTDGHLRLFSHGTFATVTGRTLLVRRKKTVVFECPLADLKSVTFEGLGLAISSDLLRSCAAAGVRMSTATLSGRPVARFVPSRPAWIDAGMAERQLQARLDEHGTRLAAALLISKIRNQRALLLYHSKYNGRSEALRRLLGTIALELASCARECLDTAGVPLPECRGRLFLIEARAAAWYWRGVQAMVPPEYAFLRRRGRGGEDLVNRCLNYGYWMLQGRIWSAVEQAALHPFIGLLHTGKRKAPALVLDLMEEFRQPVVDRAILSLAGRRANLSVNARGDLTIRTRRLVATAVGRRLGARPAGGGATSPGSSGLDASIRRQARCFREALLAHDEYIGFRMQW